MRDYIKVLTDLLDFQKKAFEFVKDKKRTGLIMNTGMGKSVIALKWLEYKRFNRVGILADKNNIENNWVWLINKHCLSNVNIFNRDVLNLDDTAGITTPYIILCNYEYLNSKRCGKLAYLVDALVLDEALKFKNIKTNIFKNIKLLSERIDNIFIMTFSLMTDSCFDIYGSSYPVVYPLLGVNGVDYMNRFLMVNADGYGYCFKVGAEKEINDIIKRFLYVDLNKYKIPEPIRYVYKLHPTQEQLEKDKLLKEKMKIYFDEYDKNKESRVFYFDRVSTIFFKRHQICGGGIYLRGNKENCLEVVPIKTYKMQMVYNLVKKYIGKKILIWYRYKFEGYFLREMLSFYFGEQNVLFYLVHTGNTVLTEFEHGEGTKILLISYSYAKGINKLANADVVIFYSNSVSFCDRLQAEGRSCRLTTEKNPIFIDLITEGLIDEAIFNLLRTKKSLKISLENLRKYTN